MATIKTIPYSIKRQCSGTWSVTTSANWISASMTSSAINVSVSANTTSSARTGTVNILLDGSQCKSITVNQDAAATSCSCPTTAYRVYGGTVSRSGAVTTRILRLEVDSGFDGYCANKEMSVSADMTTFLSSSTFSVTCDNIIRTDKNPPYKVIDVYVHNVPANPDQTGYPRAVGFYVMLNGVKCTPNYPIFQEGKANCKCEGIIDPDTGGMITILENAVDNNAHSHVEIASADTNGCGTLALINTSSGIFVNDEIIVDHQTGSNFYYWYADVLENTAGGSRSVSLDVTYTDLFGRVLDCQDKILFTQGEGVCSCPNVTPLSNTLTCTVTGDGGRYAESYLYDIFTNINLAYNHDEEYDMDLYCNFIYAETDESWLSPSTMYSGNNISFAVSASRNNTCNERTGIVKLYAYKNLNNGYDCKGEYAGVWVSRQSNCGTKCTQVGTIQVTQPSATTKYTCSNTRIEFISDYGSYEINELSVTPYNYNNAAFKVKFYRPSETGYYSDPKRFEYEDANGNPVNYFSVRGSSNYGYYVSLVDESLEINGTYYLVAIFEVDCGVECSKKLKLNVTGCSCSSFYDTDLTIPGSQEGDNSMYIDFGCQKDFLVQLCDVDGNVVSPSYYDWISNVSYDKENKELHYTVVANTGSTDRVAYLLIRGYHMVNGVKTLCDSGFRAIGTITQEKDISNPCLWCNKKLGVTTSRGYYTWQSGDTIPIVIATLWRTDSECPDGEIPREFEINSGGSEFTVTVQDYGIMEQITVQPKGTNTTVDDYSSYVSVRATQNGEYIKDYNGNICSYYFYGTQKRGQNPPPEPCSCDNSSYYIGTINQTVNSLVEGQRIAVANFIPIDTSYSKDSCLEYVIRNNQPDAMTVEIDTTDGIIYVTALETTKPEDAGAYHTAAFDVNIKNNDESQFCNVSVTLQLEIYWQN